MTYQEVLSAARGKMGPCVACAVCNGAACKNTIPGPGAKGEASVFTRNYQAWRDVLVNLDTIVEDRPVDTSFDFFGHTMKYPIFAAPIAAMQTHYGDAMTEPDYDNALVNGCHSAGIAAFMGDGLAEGVFSSGVNAMRDFGFAVPTIKPWTKEMVFAKIDQAKQAGASVLCMDIDASGLALLKNMDPPSGSKTVAQLREFIEYAGIPFILKGIMTVSGAKKALDAGAAGIVVSNHGGRVLDQTPATAQVLPSIAKAVGKDMTILVDGGVRTGLDVFKALALGADAVLIGRPFVVSVYGGREEGVQTYVNKVGGELADAMQMCGPRTLAEINSDCIWQG